MNPGSGSFIIGFAAGIAGMWLYSRYTGRTL
jgi:hypothetical protein